MKKLDNYTSLSERIEGKLYQEIARMQQAKIS